MKVALVHDWLLAPGGAELVLAAMHRMWPDAPIYTLLLDRDSLPKALESAEIRTSYLDKWKWSRRNHTKLLPLMPSAIEALDLREFDLIISSSHCVAKGVMVRPGQFHISYCHTPMRYAWDLQEEYLKAANLHKGLRGLAARAMLSRLRTWDTSSATRVDRFLANSSFVAQRINRSYGCRAGVLHPPVDVDRFKPAATRGDHFVSVSRLVPYKRVDLIIEAANRTGIILDVYGTGPEAERLKALAGPGVTMRGWATDAEVQDRVSSAAGFFTAAREDFGISTAEALAAGTPVIGLSGCGTEDIVEDVRTGVLFKTQTVDALVEAIRRLGSLEFDSQVLRSTATRFSEANFRVGLLREVERLTHPAQSETNAGA